MKQHYIYLTTNIINGMRYIGKHYGELDDAYLGSGKLLKEDIAKYGKEHFHKSILYISNDDLENSEKEKQFIALYNAVSNPLFYNIHEGGYGGNTTAGYSPEEKEALRRKLSEVNKGKKMECMANIILIKQKHFYLTGLSLKEIILIIEQMSLKIK